MSAMQLVKDYMQGGVCEAVCLVEPLQMLDVCSTSMWQKHDRGPQTQFTHMNHRKVCLGASVENGADVKGATTSNAMNQQEET